MAAGVMKHSKRSNILEAEKESIDQFGHLTEKQKREAKRLIKKARSKLDRNEGRRSFKHAFDDCED
ncbi:MAG: hypothetical protein HC836_26215 [Richelia sp. RM2_1_2]|nr:hypothetical protein [Richelia sp. RM2_1_2]